MHYLNFFPEQAQADTIREIHQEKQRWVGQNKKGFLRFRSPFEELSKYRAQKIDTSGDSILIGAAEEVDDQHRSEIEKNLRSFMPWRKGPFSVFGVEIDAEWRSEKKWHRLVPHLPDLQGKVIADVGCNNGYYMFKMMASKPAFILGFEPSVQHYYCFKALNSMAGYPNQDIDLLGVEHLGYFKESFDVIMLMGVIYHRVSPIDVLRDVFAALRPGGTLVMESQGIPGEEPIALFPEKTYAKAPGTYFVPTGSCLSHWMKRAGFRDVVSCSQSPMSPDEQRKTEWMVFESYQDYLDPENNNLTVEGYPAPVRLILTGKK